MAQSTNLSFLGIAKESTFGTVVPATTFIPVSAPSPKDNLTLLEDAGMRGSMVGMYGEVSGPISGEMDFDGDVFPDTVGWMLAGILGDVTTTGTSAPFTHAMSVLNNGTGQPASYSVTDYYVAGTRAYAGGKFSELDFKFSSDAMLTYSAKMTTLGSKVVTTPTPSFGEIPPLASWIGTVKLGGSALTTVTDGELDIKRSVTPIFTVSGNQFPTDIWSGPLTVDGKLTIVMDDDTQLVDYLNNSQPSLEIEFDSGDTSLTLHMSKVAYSAAEIGRGSDYVSIAITWSAVATVSDAGASGGYSPLLVTLTNSVADGVQA